MSAPIVRDYRSLRQGLSRRDRSLREKVMSLHDAATLVQDGMSVGIGGSTMSRTPMAMIWELMRQRRKHLSCSRGIVSTDGDLLFGSDIADEVVTSWFAQGILWGLSKVMRHHVEKGGKRFQEWSHMAMGMRFRAGGMGVPFLPIRSMLGSDVLKQRPEAKAVRLPVHRRQVAAGSGAQPGRCADPRPALRPLRQRPDRRPAVHGHRSRDGGRPGDPDDRAHHFQRSDPARAGSDEDSRFSALTRWWRSPSGRLRTNASASTSR